MKSPHVIKACDVHIARNKFKLMLILQSSKTHNKGDKPQIIKLMKNDSVRSKTDHSICPYTLMRDNVSKRSSFKSVEEQFFVFRDGTPVKPEMARKVLRQCISRIGLKNFM